MMNRLDNVFYASYDEEQKGLGEFSFKPKEEKMEGRHSDSDILKYVNSTYSEWL